MPFPNQRPFAENVYNAHFADIGAVSSTYIPVFGRGRIVDVRIAVHTSPTITTTNLTPKINGANITGAAIAIAAGVPAGSVHAATPSGASNVDKDDVVEIASDGGAANSVPATVTIVVREF
jgi:hypothetical protein